MKRILIIALAGLSYSYNTAFHSPSSPFGAKKGSQITAQSQRQQASQRPQNAFGRSSSFAQPAAQAAQSAKTQGSLFGRTQSSSQPAAQSSAQPVATKPSGNISDLESRVNKISERFMKVFPNDENALRPIMQDARPLYDDIKKSQLAETEKSRLLKILTLTFPGAQFEQGAAQQAAQTVGNVTDLQTRVTKISERFMNVFPNDQASVNTILQDARPLYIDIKNSQLAETEKSRLLGILTLTFPAVQFEQVSLNSPREIPAKTASEQAVAGKSFAGKEKSEPAPSVGPFGRSSQKSSLVVGSADLETKINAISERFNRVVPGSDASTIIQDAKSLLEDLKSAQ